MTKPIEYSLEIYEPGSRKDVWQSFSSSSPIMIMRVGDTIDPYTWPQARFGNKRIRVVAVEHLIWETAELLKQKAMLYTELAVNNPE